MAQAAVRASGECGTAAVFPAIPIVPLLIGHRELGLPTVVAPLVHMVLSVLGLPSWQCPLRATTGLWCPGCGLTGAIRCLVGGEWGAAVRMHPFAPLFLAAWVVVGLGCVLPGGVRRVVVCWLTGFERRTRLSGLVLLAFVAHGVARLVVQALAAVS